MATLFFVDKDRKLSKIEEKPFLTETDDMEEFIKRNTQVLGDLAISTSRLL